MATFNDLYDYTMPYLPGAEPGIIDFHIRRALREFFKRTTVWRESFQFNTLAPSPDPVPTYQLIPTGGAEVASVLSVVIADRWCSSRAEEQRDPQVRPAKPDSWYNLLPQVIYLYPPPDAVYAVKIEAALTLPITGTRDFPDNVMQEHCESIAAGAISGMMLMPGKPWSKTDAAATYSRIFGSAMRDLRSKLRDGGQPNVSTFTAARRFGV